MLNKEGGEAVRLALGRILDEAMTVGGARCGDVQVLNLELDALEIAAHRGLPKAFLQAFRLVHRDDGSACARAWRQGRRVAISAVDRDPAFAPYLDLAREAGFQAVQSTPIITTSGAIVGVLSTHFPRPQQPSLAEGVMLNHYAAQAAAAIQAFAGDPPADKAKAPQA